MAIAIVHLLAASTRYLEGFSGPDPSIVASRAIGSDRVGVGRREVPSGPTGSGGRAGGRTVNRPRGALADARTAGTGGAAWGKGRPAPRGAMLADGGAPRSREKGRSK